MGYFFFQDLGGKQLVIVNEYRRQLVPQRFLIPMKKFKTRKSSRIFLMSETQNLAIAVSSANCNLTKPSLIRDSVLLNNTTKKNLHKRH